MLAGNMIGGGAKMPVRLASHLAGAHDVTIVYPVIKHFSLHTRVYNSSWAVLSRHVLREVKAHKREFVWRDDLDSRVKIEPYWATPSSGMLRKFDAIIYPSVWQYYELCGLDLGKTRKIHWSLADYLFCSGTSTNTDSILRAYRSDDVQVAPSQITGKALESYGVKVASMIHGGIDPIFHSEGRSRNPGRVRVLGYYQPSWWVKGAATLLQCLAELRRGYPNIAVELVGHQPSKIEKAGSLLCDKFHTGLTSQQMADLYRTCDIFVYPSYSDGFPSPPLEAMACGCAVVATRVGAVPEYAEDGQTALLCEPMDAQSLYKSVVSLVERLELRAELGANAAVAARGWTWEKSAAQFSALLNR